MAVGNLDSYFPLSEQYLTQSEVEYCGPATLVNVLNALKIDPKNQWKGIWRWYSEQNLHCTNPLLLKKGLCLEEYSILARCNGLFIQSFRPSETLNNVKLINDQIAFLAKSKKPTIDPLHSKVITHEYEANTYCCGTNQFTVNQSTFNTFRTACIACSRRNSMILTVNSSRKFLQETGSGHFSPLCGYHNKTHSVLLLDIARYKYPPYWIECRYIYNSLIPFDCDRRKRRGFSVISKELRSGPQSEICRGIYDIVNMKKINEFLVDLYKRNCKYETIKDIIVDILKGNICDDGTIDEINVLLFSYIHDLEKRMEAHNDIKEKFVIQNLLNTEVKKLLQESEYENNKIRTVVSEMYSGDASDILSLFIMSFPSKLIEKILINPTLWEPYKLNNIKNRTVYNEILILRERMGVLCERINKGKFYSSDYIQSHSLIS